MVNMGDVWDRAVEFLSDHLGAIIPIAIFAILIPNSVSGALQPLQEGGDGGTRLVLGVLTLGFAVLQVWAQLAITALAVDPAMGRRATRLASARLVPALLVYILILIALGLLALPVAVIMALGGVDFVALSAGQPPTISPGTAAAIGLYALALFVVLLVIAARLLPLLPVIAVEKLGLGAIGRAWRLTRGLMWKLIGVIILYAVVTIVATLAARTVFGSILRLVAGGDGPVTIAGTITAVIVSAVATIFTVLATAFVAKLYVAVVRAHERRPAPPVDGGTEVL